MQRKLAAKEERIWEAFQRLDLDGDGRVTLAEIETVMKANSSDARKFIAEVDKDGDGCVSYDEFIVSSSYDLKRRCMRAARSAARSA